MLCLLLPYSKIKQRHVYMYPLPFGLPRHSRQCGTLGRVPCAAESAIEYAPMHVFGCVLTSCQPMDYSLPGFSVHENFQARILDWVAISYSRGLPEPGIKPMSLASFALAGGFFAA